MPKPHKHAALIKAWADGAEIQIWSKLQNDWFEINEYPLWDEQASYRIKPKEPIVKEVYTAIYNYPTRWSFVPSTGMGNLRLCYDPETGVLLSAEVIKKD